MAYQNSPVRGVLDEIIHAYLLNQNSLIADRVFARREMKDQGGTASVVTRQSALTPVGSMKKSSDGYSKVQTALGKHPFQCVPEGIVEPVDGDMQAPPGWNDASDTVNLLAIRIALQGDIEAAALLQDATVWDGSNAPATDAATAWATVATATPIADVTNAMALVQNATGVAPDTLVVNDIQLGYLLSNATIRASFPGAVALTRPLLESQLASIFGLSKLFVCGLRKNTSKDPDEFEGADVWSSTYAMVCKTASPDDPLAVPAIGRTFEWRTNGWQVSQEWKGGDADQWLFKAKRNYQRNVIDPAFGCLLNVAPGS